MTQGQCPSCGAPIQFTAGTAQVVICAHCRTVVARAGEALEARGKVAALVDTDSPLQVGVTGRWQGRGFRVVGHLQKDYGKGPWDEWYLELDGGERAWLAESEGEWHLMSPAGTEPKLAHASLRPDQRVHIGGREYVVEEVGTFKTLSAEGELPSDLGAPEEKYADLTGPGGGFVSLEFPGGDEAAEVYAGSLVPLDVLGISADQLRPRVHKAKLLQARCTQCNGPLELRAPDQTQRVGCPYCGALLDVSQGKLRFLQALGKPQHEPHIPLGAHGTLDGVPWICIAFLVRHCEVDSVRYPWTESLLYSKGHGFAWLVESEGHWEFLKPVAAADVHDYGQRLLYQGNRYRRFSSVQAVTDYVLGECYWAVSQGETSEASEYVDPPRTLSREKTEGEVTWVAGRYVARAELEKAFNAKLPAQRGVGAAQPNPYASGKSLWAWFGIYACAILALFIVARTLSTHQTVLDESVTIPAGVTPGTPESMHFTQPFQLTHAGNLEVQSSSSPLNNDWLGLDMDLVDDETGDVTSFYTELSYYSGYDSDGSWSEGSTVADDFVSRIPAGRYVLRVTPSFAVPNKSYRIVLISDVPRFLWVVFAWLALLIWPLFNGMRHGSFEKRRWEESST